MLQKAASMPKNFIIREKERPNANVIISWNNRSSNDKNIKNCYCYDNNYNQSLKITATAAKSMATIAMVTKIVTTEALIATSV